MDFQGWKTGPYLSMDSLALAPAFSPELLIEAALGRQIL